jgi:antitoxin YefM
MDSMSLSQFRELLDDCKGHIGDQHTPVKVTTPQGNDFVVISTEDWQREQETLYVLQNNSLIQQIVESLATHTTQDGYQPSEEEINAFLSI